MSLLNGTDILAISGGVPMDIPLVQAAQAKGITLINDSQEFSLRSPALSIGITGSAGKTTTTALTGAMGQASGRHTWIGGNIGRPLISDLDNIQPGDLVVQELSSFQLEIWQHSPPIAAVLNLTPNHLDRHKTMASYRDAKANILRFQNENDTAVLSADDPGSLSLAPLVRGRLRLFSIERDVQDGAILADGQIWLKRPGEDALPLCSLENIQLRGRHNVLNVCAAVTLADSAGIPIEAMVEAIKNFKGVEHRLEYVDTINDITFVNDSIATAPERALAAIDSFDEPLILLAGGKDKNMEWEKWAGRVCERISTIILFGALADLLIDKLEQAKSGSNKSLKILRASDLEEAVSLAFQNAHQGDVVLLSHGGTSYDAYEDFAQRGRHFRSVVSELRRS